MVQIFVIKDAGAFKVSASAFIILASEDKLADLIATGTLEAVTFPAYTEDERAAFISDYTALIASLNSLYKEKLLWWGTDISSKNSYFCPLPDLLQELLEIERALQSHKDKPLLIVGPSIGIYGALRKALTKYGRELFWPQATRKMFCKQVIGAGANFLRLFIRALRFYARALWARIALRRYAHKWLSQQKKFYVIKTFSYPNSWNSNGEYTDAFFGRLPRILSKDNDVLILSYHWQGYREFIKYVLHEETQTILPVEFFLKGSDVLRSVFRILSFHLPVDKEVFFRGLDISDILRFELARTMNGVQVFQLLHYDAMRHMLKQLQVKTFLFTFENNPWERMCMLACRKHSPSTKLIGYQHSVVPQAALNMFIHPLEKNIVPLPDRILTTGEIPKNIIQYYGDYSNVPVMSACAVRYEYLSGIKPSSRQKSRGHILLVLDGVDQTQQMLRFVLEQLGGKSHYRLRIRCHPALPWSLLAIKFHFDVSKYANVEISKGVLSEDLDWSGTVIYWQSAVVLEAVSMGKPVINFKSDGLLSYDPLFQTNGLKWIVTEKDNLLNTIDTIEQMDDQTYHQQFESAISFIRRYFHPVVPEALQLFKFDV